MRYVSIPYNKRKTSFKYKSISPLKNHLMSYFFHYVACGVDKYPRNMPCRKTHACSKLAARRGCNKRFSQILPRWCWQKLSAKDRRQLVKNYCRKSCRNCVGKCQNEFFLTKEKSNMIVITIKNSMKYIFCFRIILNMEYLCCGIMNRRRH